MVLVSVINIPISLQIMMFSKRSISFSFLNLIDSRKHSSLEWAQLVVKDNTVLLIVIFSSENTFTTAIFHLSSDKHPYIELKTSHDLRPPGTSYYHQFCDF